MSGAHHTDPIEENIDSHPVQIAIWIVLGAFALIVAIILAAQFAIGMYSERSRKGDRAMSEAAVDKRIAPEARLAVDPNAPVAPPAPTPAAIAAVAPPPTAKPTLAAAGAGKATFEAVCKACHGTGVAGAPLFGNKAAWAPRIAQGKEVLYNAALHGFKAMPPKGGNPSLSDADVKAAVDYMVAAAK